MYRDSLHTFDSPQLCGRRPHCLQRRYLSHCSWINMPGLWARWYSSSSRSLLRFTLAAQESSRERRASKRSWCRRARSKMILQENGEDINIPNVVNKLKSSKLNNYVTGIVLVVHHSKYRRLKNENRQKSNTRLELLKPLCWRLPDHAQSSGGTFL